MGQTTPQVTFKSDFSKPGARAVAPQQAARFAACAPHRGAGWSPGPGAELLSRHQGGFALSSFTAFGDEQNENVQ